MKKVSYKGIDLGFLEKGIGHTQVLIYKLYEIGLHLF